MMQARGFFESTVFQGTYSTVIIQSSNGNFYGVADSGGKYYAGSFFQITTNGTATTLYSFDRTNGLAPCTLMQGTDGFFYGISLNTDLDSENVFRISANGELTVIGTIPTIRFDNIYGIIQSVNGGFYGLTSSGNLYATGNLFSFQSGGLLNIITNIPDYPIGIVDGKDGFLYGMGNYGGSLLKISTNGVFSNISLSSRGTTTPVLGVDSNFYGTLIWNGVYTPSINSAGGLFKSTKNGTLIKLHSFDYTNGASPNMLAVGADGNLYGTTPVGGLYNNGIVFVATTNGLFTNLNIFDGIHGATPLAALTTGVDGTLYGTTTSGGIAGHGTLFQVTTNAVVNTLCSLPGPNGAIPPAAISSDGNGNFYGVTTGGGSSECGTIFKLDASGNLTTLYSFGINLDTNGNMLDGALPEAELTWGNNGFLYGTTCAGGTNGSGTIFRISTNGIFTTLISFNGTNGSNPQGKLIQADDYSFYGTTIGGGIYKHGTVFNLTPEGVLTTLVSFDRTNGANPYAGLVRGTNGNFYGTTATGPTNSRGTVFMITTNGSLTNLVSFNRTNGACPIGNLILGSDGNFYGTTAGGGSGKLGTVFQLTPSGILTTLVSFNGTNGATPCAGLTVGQDGAFYGTTRGGIGGFGTIFRVGTNGSLITLVTFSNSIGVNPMSGLIADGTGNFFGTTPSGGSSGQGNIYHLFIRPTLQSIINPDGTITLSWDSFSGLSYQLLRTSDLTSGNWSSVGNTIIANSSITSQVDSPSASQQWFYRVALLP